MAFVLYDIAYLRDFIACRNFRVLVSTMICPLPTLIQFFNIFTQVRQFKSIENAMSPFCPSVTFKDITFHSFKYEFSMKF